MYNTATRSVVSSTKLYFILISIAIHPRWCIRVFRRSHYTPIVSAYILCISPLIVAPLPHDSWWNHLRVYSPISNLTYMFYRGLTFYQPRGRRIRHGFDNILSTTRQIAHSIYYIIYIYLLLYFFYIIYTYTYIIWYYTRRRRSDRSWPIRCTERGRRKFSLRIVTLMIYGQVFAENPNYMYRPVMTRTRAQRAPIPGESVRGPRRAGRRL
jgi:hypothetical protein